MSGKYILAVSGGVDSMALLNMLSKLAGVDLVVAHFDHGIRPDSAEDEKLVSDAAARLGLPFESGRARLGPGASEDAARRARYGFLEAARQKHGARTIVTAHHQDDLIETALINLLRGTGRRGLVAISSNQNILRPLINCSKKQILRYAAETGLQWREDPTNQSSDYLRNYIRHNLMPKMTPAQRRRLLAHIGKIQNASPKIDSWLEELSAAVRPGADIDRAAFIALPSPLGGELLMYWLRRAGMSDFDRRTIDRLNVAIRTSRDGSVHSVKKNLTVEIGVKTARFSRRPQNADNRVI